MSVVLGGRWELDPVCCLVRGSIVSDFKLRPYRQVVFQEGGRCTAGRFISGGTGHRHRGLGVSRHTFTTNRNRNTLGPVRCR